MWLPGDAFNEPQRHLTVGEELKRLTRSSRFQGTGEIDPALHLLGFWHGLGIK